MYGNKLIIAIHPIRKHSTMGFFGRCLDKWKRSLQFIICECITRLFTLICLCMHMVPLWLISTLFGNGATGHSPQVPYYGHRTLYAQKYWVINEIEILTSFIWIYLSVFKMNGRCSSWVIANNAMLCNLLQVGSVFAWLFVLVIINYFGFRCRVSVISFLTVNKVKRRYFIDTENKYDIGTGSYFVCEFKTYVMFSLPRLAWSKDRRIKSTWWMFANRLLNYGKHL